MRVVFLIGVVAQECSQECTSLLQLRAEDGPDRALFGALLKGAELGAQEPQTSPQPVDPSPGPGERMRQEMVKILEEQMNRTRQALEAASNASDAGNFTLPTLAPLPPLPALPVANGSAVPEATAAPETTGNATAQPAQNSTADPGTAEESAEEGGAVEGEDETGSAFEGFGEEDDEAEILGDPDEELDDGPVPGERTPPPPDMEAVNATFADLEKKFDASNPLLEATVWSSIGVPVLCAMLVVTGCMVSCVWAGTEGDHEDQKLALPDNLYGEMYATILVSASRGRRDGWSFKIFSHMFSSCFMFLLLFLLLYMLIGAAYHSMGEVEEDVDERDAVFEKFRNPVIWMNQDWETYPDTNWNRESMIWFCHDVIYGKAKHVVELGPDWNMFSGVVLFIWVSYMVKELRECLSFFSLTWSFPSLPVEQMLAEDGKDVIRVDGIAFSLKVFLTLVVIIPKLFMNFYVAVIGCQYLMFNDLADDMQEILLKTIELAFILEMDELIFMAFVSYPKKEQVTRMDFPPLKSKGLLGTLSAYGELPRFVLICVLVSCLTMYMHSETHERKMLTAKEEGVIEGCCNFMQYLKGAGVKTPLAAGNPCSHFREAIESPLGMTIPAVEGGSTPSPFEPEYETIIDWKDTMAQTWRSWLQLGESPHGWLQLSQILAANVTRAYSLEPGMS